MIADYTNNPELFESCMNLLNEVFPGCKEFALKGIKYNASWAQDSIPFIVEKKGEIIAHAGVWPITLILNGKKHHTASIHGVGVKPEYRGKGYFKQLMNETMQYVEDRFDSSLLFTAKTHLYKSYPYKAMIPEYDFSVNQNIKSHSKNSDLRILNLDSVNDLNIVDNLISHRVPLSNQISVLNRTLFILNTLNRKLYYSEILNAIIVFEIANNTLYLQEIMSPKQHSLVDIIEIIPGDFNKTVLQFCPDNFLDKNEYSAVFAEPECCIMVSNQFSFNSQYFRYPELYWC